MSGSAPISKDTGSIGILYICAATNTLAAIILFANGRNYGGVNSLAMALIFLGWARHAAKLKEIVDLLGGEDAEEMMRHAQRLEAETEALSRKTLGRFPAGTVRSRADTVSRQGLAGSAAPTRAPRRAR